MVIDNKSNTNWSKEVFRFIYDFETKIKIILQKALVLYMMILVQLLLNYQSLKYEMIAFISVEWLNIVVHLNLLFFSMVFIDAIFTWYWFNGSFSTQTKKTIITRIDHYSTAIWILIAVKLGSIQAVIKPFRPNNVFHTSCVV